MQSTGPGEIDSRPIGTAALPTKVYSPGQVAGAAFVGSPIAGCILLASNFSLFGAPDQRRRALIGGILATIAVIALGFFLPPDFPNAVMPAAYTTALLYFANRTQASDIEAFIASGGSKHSHWRVFGIGLFWMLVVVILLFTVIYFVPEEWLPEITA
jgi:hypothetical protein